MLNCAKKKKRFLSSLFIYFLFQNNFSINVEKNILTQAYLYMYFMYVKFLNYLIITKKKNTIKIYSSKN